ncbi:TlpA family protein disulfide reductase [Verrucomicrobiaceae bacterium 5K15]|uniref:TlpA family protein disulfide reductase n=1 Tax=Oceaniferula flava TaxID=2800421 RepID=A0AAE2SDU9_9BACT|nr:TlpA disulfide reductase family protein [Oceaniferula flavus]MBK1855934.1 TlpA family protein disulfide reductase [Oceaniferula flavus]MBM1137241.1 TlpA family protein disulfide reductase [Oceaniferula flavus]
MKRTSFYASLGLALSSLLIAGPAQDIVNKHAKATAAELEAYLKENPDAEDKSRAHQALLVSYNTTGETQKSIGIFQEKFDALGSGAEVPTMALYSTTNSLCNLMLKAGMKKEAGAVVAQAIEKATGNPKEAQLKQAFQTLQGRLNKPGKGDTMAMKFTSVQGEEIDLAAMKGKVVLIDFWATWCGPCIAELPHVMKTYEKYHEQGFEVIGISLDKKSDRAKLEAFIEKRKMPWPQHFEEEQSGNRFAIEYGITSIPATFLIGKDGTIVATNLRGEALEKTVGEHIAK